MSAILNAIQTVIQGAVSVEVKAPVVKSGKTRFPILVTDVSNSVTNGWFVQYNPVAQENNTRLYDGSETFSELSIARFSELYNLILTGNYYFLNNQGVETLSEGRRRAIYEPDGRIRLTVTSQTNSVSVVVTIVDESSPFYMMSIPFTVTNHNNQPYIVGSDKHWNRTNDTLVEFNANFAPRKARFHRIQQQQNGPAVLRGAKLAVRNGQYAINQDGSFEVDTKTSAPEYIQVVNNEYKALAYIYEQALMKHAFAQALQQGLPVVAQQNNTYVPSPNQQPANGFIPAFGLGNLGGPNTQASASIPTAPAQVAPPVTNFTPGAQGTGTPPPAFPAPVQPAQPATQATTATTEVPPIQSLEISEEELPWGTN